MVQNSQKNRQNGDGAESLQSEGGCDGQEHVHGLLQARAVQIGACFRSVAEGRLAALGELYDLTAADLYGYIRSIVWCATDAEDVFQEVFAKIAARGPKLIRVEKPLAYMFTIARNEAFGLLNKKIVRRQGGEDGAFFEEPAARESAAPALTAREAHEALTQLPEDQREAVVLKIYEGFTFSEIGDITGSSTNTAASRYRYGISKLAKLLGRTIKVE